MIRKQMRSRTKRFLSAAGLASIVLGTPSALESLLTYNLRAAILPGLFIIGGLLLINMVVREQVPKTHRRKKR